MTVSWMLSFVTAIGVSSTDGTFLDAVVDLRVDEAGRRRLALRGRDGELGRRLGLLA